jgi:biotin operon repressor
LDGVIENNLLRRRTNMLALRKVLQSIEKGLEGLAKRTKDMQILLDNLEEALAVEQPQAKPGAKRKAAKRAPSKKRAAGKKPAKATATDVVLTAIGRSKRGASTAQIKAKTGFSERKIWDIVNRLKKQGKIKSEKKGVYMKA